MRDTSPEAKARYFDLLRRMSCAERLEMASALTTVVRELALAGIRHDSPELTERQAKRKLVERLYGRDTAERLFGATSGR